MANINCEICGGSRLVKQGDRFICNDCGTSYSLEDARNLLQQNNYHKCKEQTKLDTITVLQTSICKYFVNSVCHC